MDNQINKEELFIDQDLSLLNFLNNFVKTLQIDDDKDLVDMTTSKLLLKSIDNNYSINEFINLLNKKNIKDGFTGLFLHNFNKKDDIDIIRIIEKYNGIYNVQLNYHMLDSQENNEIYAAFVNSLDAYKCFLDIDCINQNNNEIEDISYLL